MSQVNLPRSLYGATGIASLNTQLQLTNKHIGAQMTNLLVAPNLLNKTASISSTKLYTTQSAEDASYEITLILITTAVGTGGTVTATFTWNNGSGTQSVTTPSINLTSLGNEVDFHQKFYCAVGQNMTYSTTVAGATGTPTYSLYIRLVHQQ